MQFAHRRKKPTTEERLARWSTSLLGSSIVLFVVFFTLGITIAAQSNWSPLAVACLSIYVAQFYFLGRIGKYESRQRLRIWLLSLLGHIFLFGAVLSVVGKPSLAFVVLLPEAASGIIHMAAISLELKTLRAA